MPPASPFAAFTTFATTPLVGPVTEGNMTDLLRRVLQNEPMLLGRSISSSVLSGSSPVAFDSANPITLFIVQLFIIITFTQGLGFLFRYIKQPSVVAEVIGGILLGPTVMGRIPHFSTRIFPTQSISYLNLISTIGLILFLFLVGLEVDIGILKRNGRSAALISLSGMILPFGLGAAVAVPIYHNFVDSERVTFGHFMLFCGVAMAITAFPVLCRILTATKLLDSTVGVIVLAAGAGNDVVGWVLLALTLALVNASSGVTAVYVLLCAVGWCILLLWPIKKGFRWIVRRSGSLDHGPTPSIMVLTLLIVFASAFVTGIIGVHPIFGAFIAGLIIPHEGGFAISLVKKIDDLVTMLFLPIYFALNGLQTNLSLINTGKDWAFVIMICVVAFVGKFFGCAVTARLCKYNLRESSAIGMLMSCKGLVELIVLNVGLQVHILDQRLFSMFVVEAVVLTFITTPLTLLIYPERVRSRASAALQNGTKRDDEKKTHGMMAIEGGSGGRDHVDRFLIVLQKIEHLAPVMLLTQMLEPLAKDSIDNRIHAKQLPQDGDAGDVSEVSMKSSPSHQSNPLPVLDESGRLSPPRNGPQIDALKLVELTGRTYSVMQSAEKDQLLLTDDALQLFRQFGRLRGLDVNPHISIVGEDSFASAVGDYADALGSQLVILPWTVPAATSSGQLIDSAPLAAEKEGITGTGSVRNQFEQIFGSETQGSPMYTHFVRRVFNECPSDVAVFVDRGFGSSSSFTPGAGQHIFLPFFGGPDDRLALRLVIQLCHHSNVTATVARLEKTDHTAFDEEPQSPLSESGRLDGLDEQVRAHQAAMRSNQLTVGATASAAGQTANVMASSTADDIAWTYFTAPSSSVSRGTALEAALRRVSFWSQKTSTPLTSAHAAADTAIANATQQGRQWRPGMVITGRGRKGAAIRHDEELTRLLTQSGQNPNVGAELRKTVGDSATGLMLGGQGAVRGASFLVVEAGRTRN